MSSTPPPADPDQLRDEIAQTRADLGDTVQELVAKTDVKTRAKAAATHAAGEARQKVNEKVSEAKPVVAARLGVLRRRATLVKGRAVTVARKPETRRALPAVAAGAAVLGAVVVVARRRRPRRRKLR